MAPPQIQTAVIQAPSSNRTAFPTLGLALSHAVPVPALTLPGQSLVRVSAVALNPTDHKIIAHFPRRGGMTGCDFCGIIVDSGPDAAADGFIKPGTRVCGAVFPYGAPDDMGEELRSGAFSQWVVADTRLLLRVPDSWSDTEGAALGGVGWGTVGLAVSDPNALGLEGTPSRPAKVVDDKTGDREPVLIYGGATATGTMACQLLKLSGYSPIAVTSPRSESLALQYGAAAIAHYTSPNCAEEIRTRMARPGLPIRRVVDCITSPDSAATCFAAMARTGGRYACLEHLPADWRTRRAVSVKEIQGYEGLGRRVTLEPTPSNGHDDDSHVLDSQRQKSTYTCEANPALFAVTQRWRDEVQTLLDQGLLRSHPAREIKHDGDWGNAIIQGLSQLQRGEIRGQKLVVHLPNQVHLEI